MQLEKVNQSCLLVASMDTRIKALDLMQQSLDITTDQARSLESRLYTQYHNQKEQYVRSIKRIVFNVMNNSLLKEGLAEHLLMLPSMTNQDMRKGTQLEEWYLQFQQHSQRQQELLQNSTQDIQHTPASSNTKAIMCHRCKSDDVAIEQKQTRSADEGMTVFVTCNKCQLRWRM